MRLSGLGNVKILTFYNLFLQRHAIMAGSPCTFKQSFLPIFKINRMIDAMIEQTTIIMNSLLI
jgi:hypothetical protein